MGNWLKKDFLLGIGAGCIISGMLVSILGFGGISDEEVVARASKLGMVKQSLPWNGTDSSNQSQDAGPSSKSGQPQTTETVPKPAPAQTTGSTAKSNPAPTPAQPQGDITAGKVNGTTTTITITNRMGSEAVARVLEKKGVIKDQYEFLRVVESHKAQRRFQTGTFTVPVGGDMEEILAILTGKKR